jgi:hypothetical protein
MHRVRISYVACMAVLLAACASGGAPQSTAQFDDRNCLYLPDRSKPGVTRKFPLTEDYRPAGLSGTTVLNICVEADGELAGDPTVVTSSGNELIDRATVTLLKAGSYCPAFANGAPVDGCFDMRIRMGPDAPR